LAEGAMHESFNLASIWKLPVLFVCENNGWSEFSPTSRQLAADPCALALSHRIEARSIDGNDVLAVHDMARTLVAEIRGGGGPRFLECRTTRVRGHFEGDPQKYRDAADAARSDDDPIGRLERRLAADGVPVAEIKAAERDAVARVDAAVARARAGTAPAFGDALRDVYAPLEARP
jgi:pyruvate dehydrogenase E1 component alpha subunit